MGSSSYGPYVGVGGGSQPYAETYHVVPKVLAIDKKDQDIYSSKTGYFKNPTAINIEKSIKNDIIYVDGKKQYGSITYVLTKDNKLILGLRNNPNDNNKRSPHPTLIGGKNPKVQCAGIITFHNGKIYKVDTDSGHYRPDIKSLSKVDKYLDKLYKKKPNVFAKDSKWRKNNE